jgi:hypothetical protein
VTQGRQKGEDVVAEVDDEEMIEIIECRCPHGHRSLRKDLLELEGATEECVSNGIQCLIIGVVCGQSLKDLEEVLKCSDRELKNLGRQMSERILLGSIEIWRQQTREVTAMRSALLRKQTRA